MIKKFFFSVAIVGALTAPACGPMQRAFTPTEITFKDESGNTVTRYAPSPVVDAVDDIAPLFGPWGEIVLIALIAIQNGFLAAKKVVDKKKGK